MAHLLPAPVVADHVLGERDVGGAARLQRDGVRAEVLQHVQHVGEPEVLHPALAGVAEGHAEVLCATLEQMYGCFTSFCLTCLVGMGEIATEF